MYSADLTGRKAETRATVQNGGAGFSFSFILKKIFRYLPLTATPLPFVDCSM